MNAVSLHPSARCLAASLVVALLAACSAAEPYVRVEHEFNRNAPGFGQTPADIENVDICYARHATTPEAVTALAVERCGRYGKRAVFYGQDILRCPMLTPVRARYRCLAP